MATRASAETACVRHLRTILTEAGCHEPARSAFQLVEEFGSFGGVIAASPARLRRFARGDRKVVRSIKAFRSAMVHVLRCELKAKPICSSWDVLLDYLRVSMAFDHTEHVRVLHLNTRNRLIRDEVMYRGTIDESAFHVREVICRAIDLGSAAIIVVHNHPSGDPTPSRMDIDMTRKLAEAGKRLGVSLHDHVIMATSGHSSLRAMGLL